MQLMYQLFVNLTQRITSGLERSNTTIT